MARLTEELWKTLQELSEEQFEDFKWLLKGDDIVDGFSGIPAARLEKAERRNTVDLMVQKYQGAGALKVTKEVLKKIGRNDLVESLQNVCSGLKDLKTQYRGPRKEEHNQKKVKLDLKSVQRFAVNVTLDPQTAHPHLILSDDGKQVRHGDVRQKLPDNPERFNVCVNVLGQRSFSTGRHYFEVHMKRKTAWAVGVVKESIKRKGSITANPKNGYWTIVLSDGDLYGANDDDSVCLPVNQPHKVGVFVGYEEGLVSFYDVDAADHLYSFTGCSFTEKLYPFFSPCTNDKGKNSGPIVIAPVKEKQIVRTPDSGISKEEYERKKAELQSVQQFAVDVTLDQDTAHPALILSDDGKQVYCGEECKNLPNSSKRFSNCVNVLGKPSFSAGKSYYEVQVKRKTAWTLGMASESIKRKGKITLSPEDGFWTICLKDGDEYKAIDQPVVQLSPKSNPKKVGVFLDYEEGRISFYDIDTADLLYSFTDCEFTENIYPFFSPCTGDGGTNAAPLIVSSLGNTVTKEEYDRKRAELTKIQQFAVDVTLDRDTAHRALFVSADKKQVYDGDVFEKLPDNPKRFKRCVNILGEQSFSTGKSYYEVQVKGKTAWTVGVASESINRKGKVTLSPEDGFWTIWLRNEDEYTANDDSPVRLSLNQELQKVGVFVDYEEGLVSFYDVDTADLLYSYTEWTFTEKLYPFFSPCTHDDGVNSAPLIICSVNDPTNTKTNEVEDPEDYERKKAELQSVQQFAMDVSLDPDTAHPHLILSDDGKQVYHGDVRRKLPYSPKRFKICVNVLGKPSFSKGRSYYEVQVRGKTAWTLGVTTALIDPKKDITLSPEDGFWTLCLRDGDKYKAIDEPVVCLSLKSRLEKVGVFVDYEEGRVSFYDADSADLLYSFTGCSFSETLLPYFSPCTNDKGSNSAPLILCPVNLAD